MHASTFGAFINDYLEKGATVEELVVYKHEIQRLQEANRGLRNGLAEAERQLGYYKEDARESEREMARLRKEIETGRDRS
jgi:predicted  nucleic acid-binding Zn-ribbon protein